jgi:hypothetical protein
MLLGEMPTLSQDRSAEAFVHARADLFRDVDSEPTSEAEKAQANGGRLMSRFQAYQPMERKELVPESRMHEILAKHKLPGLKPGEQLDPTTGEIHGQQPESIARPPAREPAVQPGVVGVDQAPRLLTWLKPDKGATGVRTLCGRYSCSKVTVLTRTTYELWKLVPSAWFRQIAVGQESFAQIQELAEIDARGGKP